MQYDCYLVRRQCANGGDGVHMLTQTYQVSSPDNQIKGDPGAWGFGQGQNSIDNMYHVTKFYTRIGLCFVY
jgi:hypothetical protein